MDSGVCFGVCTFYHLQNGLNEERLLSVIPEHMILCVVLLFVVSGHGMDGSLPTTNWVCFGRKNFAWRIYVHRGIFLASLSNYSKNFSSYAKLFNIVPNYMPNYSKL